MSIQGALSGATNQIIGASIAAAKSKEAKTKEKVQQTAPQEKTDAELLAEMGIHVDPSRINPVGPVSRKLNRPFVDEARREEVMQNVALAQKARKLTKIESKLYMQKIRDRRKRGV